MHRSAAQPLLLIIIVALLGPVAAQELSITGNKCYKKTILKLPMGECGEIEVKGGLCADSESAADSFVDGLSALMSLFMSDGEASITTAMCDEFNAGMCMADSTKVKKTGCDTMCKMYQNQIAASADKVGCQSDSDCPAKSFSMESLDTIFGDEDEEDSGMSDACCDDMKDMVNEICSLEEAQVDQLAEAAKAAGECKDTDCKNYFSSASSLIASSAFATLLALVALSLQH